jgi:hypothetical protein
MLVLIFVAVVYNELDDGPSCSRCSNYVTYDLLLTTAEKILHYDTAVEPGRQVLVPDDFYARMLCESVILLTTKEGPLSIFLMPEIIRPSR